MKNISFSEVQELFNRKLISSNDCFRSEQKPGLIYFTDYEILYHYDHTKKPRLQTRKQKSDRLIIRDAICGLSLSGNYDKDLFTRVN